MTEALYGRSRRPGSLRVAWWGRPERVSSASLRLDRRLGSLACGLILASALGGCRSEALPKIVSDNDRAIAAVHAAQAEVMLKDGALEEALVEVEEVLRNDPLTAEHRMLAMRALCAAGMQNKDPKLYQEGVRHADVACASDPENIHFLLERGRAQFERRYYTRTIADISAAFALGSTDAESGRRLALAHRGLRQPMAERRAWEALIARQPNDARAHYELGRLLQRIAADDEETQVAVASLERAAAIAPSDAEILHALADQRAKDGDFTGAEALLLRAVSAAQDPVREQDALVSLGACAQARSGWTEARGYYERAVALDPKDPRALANLGFVMAKLDNRRDARRYLEDALDLEQDDGVKGEIDDFLKGLKSSDDPAEDPDPDAEAARAPEAAASEQNARGLGANAVAADGHSLH